KICVVNMHPGHDQGTTVDEFENVIAKRADRQQIIDQISGSNYIIVMGDMNNPNNGLNFAGFNKQGTTAIFGKQLYEDTHNKVNTCCDTRLNNQPGPFGQFDHIFANTKNIKYYYSAPSGPASDHLPVIAKIDFSAAPKATNKQRIGFD